MRRNFGLSDFRGHELQRPQGLDWVQNNLYWLQVCSVHVLQQMPAEMPVQAKYPKLDMSKSVNFNKLQE